VWLAVAEDHHNNNNSDGINNNTVLTCLSSSVWNIYGEILGGRARGYRTVRVAEMGARVGAVPTTSMIRITHAAWACGRRAMRQVEGHLLGENWALQWR
jgi:hypothetical protein